METRCCSTCKQELPLSEFWKRESGRNDLQHNCKSCTYAYKIEKRRSLAGSGVIDPPLQDRFRHEEKWCPGCKCWLPLDKYGRGMKKWGKLDGRLKCDSCRKTQRLKEQAARRERLLARTELPDVVEKMCNGCLEVLPSKYFHGSKMSGDGLQYRCKQCTSIDNKVNWAFMSDEEKQRRGKRVQAWNKQNPENKRAHNNHRRCRMKNVEGFHEVAEWLAKKQEFNHTCPSCLKSEPEIRLTRDHIIPITRGGTNYISNIQPLCQRCNPKKKTRTIYYKPEGGILRQEDESAESPLSNVSDPYQSQGRANNT